MIYEEEKYRLYCLIDLSFDHTIKEMRHLKIPKRVMYYIILVHNICFILIVDWMISIYYF